VRATSGNVDIEGPGCEVLVVGCGNLLRGDDGVGPILVRHLWELGVPDGARLVDGGTAGMDVAFQMRGAGRVVIVDASATGATPGTVYRVPGAELAELPPLRGLHTHSFRWDHAIAFARWALRDACPDDITVFLIEAVDVALGAELSEPVQRAMEQVIAVIERDYLAPLRPTEDGPDEFTDRVPNVDRALRVETVVELEEGRWAVDVVVVFADGVVRHRIDTFPTRALAEISARLIKRAAERELRGPLNG
jgi:hydrogenase maturation protease